MTTATFNVPQLTEAFEAGDLALDELRAILADPPQSITPSRDWGAAAVVKLYRLAGYICDGPDLTRPDERLVVWRGATAGDPHGVHWTLDEGVAHWYAGLGRFTSWLRSREQAVYVATIDPEHVLARYGRGDQILIDPDGLIDPRPNPIDPRKVRRATVARPRPAARPAPPREERPGILSPVQKQLVDHAFVILDQEPDMGMWELTKAVGRAYAADWQARQQGITPPAPAPVVPLSAPLAPATIAPAPRAPLPAPVPAGLRGAALSIVLDEAAPERQQERWEAGKRGEHPDPAVSRLKPLDIALPLLAARFERGELTVPELNAALARQPATGAEALNFGVAPLVALYRAAGWVTDDPGTGPPVAPATLYRGGLADVPLGMSWSPSLAVARRFAFASGTLGALIGRRSTVYAAEVDPASVLAYFRRGGEMEWVIDPSGVKNLREIGDEQFRRLAAE